MDGPQSLYSCGLVAPRGASHQPDAADPRKLGQKAGASGTGLQMVSVSRGPRRGRAPERRVGRVVQRGALSLVGRSRLVPFLTARRAAVLVFWIPRERFEPRLLRDHMRPLARAPIKKVAKSVYSEFWAFRIRRGATLRLTWRSCDAQRRSACEAHAKIARLGLDMPLDMRMKFVGRGDSCLLTAHGRLR